MQLDVSNIFLTFCYTWKIFLQSTPVENLKDKHTFFTLKLNKFIRSYKNPKRVSFILFSFLFYLQKVIIEEEHYFRDNWKWRVLLFKIIDYKFMFAFTPSAAHGPLLTLFCIPLYSLLNNNDHAQNIIMVEFVFELQKMNSMNLLQWLKYLIIVIMFSSFYTEQNVSTNSPLNRPSIKSLFLLLFLSSLCLEQEKWVVKICWALQFNQPNQDSNATIKTWIKI